MMFSGKKEQTKTHIPLDIEMLRLDRVTSFDLYIQPEGKGEFVLYRERNLRFTGEEFRRLKDTGVEQVYIRCDQEKAYQRYIEDHLGGILRDDAVPAEQKAEMLYGSLVNVVEDVMNDPRAGDVIPRSRNVVENTCTFLYEQKGSLEFMMRVCSFDYYTYTHSINVFVFAMALAQRVFGRDHVSNEFGMGALLHDVGKSKIDPAIINAPGKLTDEQFAIMKMHPVFGYEILKESGGMTELSLSMVRHHHERIKGGGYPDNLSGDQIIKEVRILTIADIFDALTTRRSYKDPMGSFRALKLMREEMASHIDMELFREFVVLMGDPSNHLQGIDVSPVS